MAAKALIVLAILAITFAVSSSSQIPSFSAQDVHENIDDIAHAARTLGAFSLHNLPNSASYQKSLRTLRRDAPDCFEDSTGRVKKVVLDDGVTRATSAVSTADSAKTQTHPPCVDTNLVETFFDEAEDVVYDIIKTLNGDHMPEYYHSIDHAKPTKLSDSAHLDHLHVYSKPATSINYNQAFTAPKHVDNGLFLLLTPTPEHPLIVYDANNGALEAANGEVVVLFGRAMEEWLFQEEGRTTRFRAAPHAVKSLAMRENFAGDRVVFARMIVAPREASPKQIKGLKTFGQIFHNDNKDQASVANNHCTNSGSLFQRAQQLECEDPTVYCWETCLPVDPDCPIEEQRCTTLNEEPCCLADDPECDLHDGSCEWKCGEAN